jgi:hypothetical protein
MHHDVAVHEMPDAWMGAPPHAPIGGEIGTSRQLVPFHSVANRAFAEPVQSVPVAMHQVVPTHDTASSEFEIDAGKDNCVRAQCPPWSTSAKPQVSPFGEAVQ